MDIRPKLYYEKCIVIGDKAFATQDNELTIRIATHTGRVIMTDDERDVLHKLLHRMQFITHH